MRHDGSRSGPKTREGLAEPPATSHPQSDDPEWFLRSRHWSSLSASPKDKRVRRQPRREPLILAGQGVSLRIEAGTLLIRNGFTHYPQKQETYRYFKGDADLPRRIIMLDGSGSITFDVLTWLNEQKVPLVKIDWTGNAVTVVSGDSFAANRERVAGRLRRDPIVVSA
jgi:CRISP-associated protein Cas1